MVCKMVKKGVVGAALGAGALALLFGTAAPSYVKTAFCKVRHSAKQNVPVPFEIDRARQELADLKPAADRCLENVCHAEYQVEKLREDIQLSRANLDRQLKQVAALRASLESGEYKVSGDVSYTPAEIKRELARRWDRYKDGQSILAKKEETLKARQSAVHAAREQLDAMRAAQQALLSKIEAIEAKYRQVEANQAASIEGIDDSALSRVKQTVAELEERVDVMGRVAEQQAKYTEKALPVEIENAGRDVLKEIDAELGAPKATGTSAVEKKL